ncbi:MAG: endolytic transglycosylase MltG [Hyphomicrobium sp.]|nr:endolytic transglycosylase MltG [Hyphomicrobium sp.]
MSNRRKKPDVTGRTKTAAARSPAERLEPGRAPSRPRGLEAREPSRFVAGTVRVFSGLFTVALVAMLTLSGAGLVVLHQYESPGPLETARTFVVPKGEGRIAIAERLEREGIITNRWTFIGGHLVQSMFGAKKTPELKAGEYELKERTSMRQVMDVLAEGKSILYKVTVPEGLTSQQIVERLKGEANLTGDITKPPAEGTLLPDTYQFSKGASRQEIIEKMQAEMQKTLAKFWDKRPADLPLRTVEEAVTFASIVEKETGKPDERDRVAAVFYNRLKKGMRLQSDPTIIYGITGGQGTLGRGLTRTEIDTKTAYNTYQINGLPPGPIANPGRAALEATFSPAKTNDLYFVADGTGGHAFSETLKEHNSAVQKWREVEKQTKPKTMADERDAAAPDPDVTPIPEPNAAEATDPDAPAQPAARHQADSGKSNAKPDGKADAKAAASKGAKAVTPANAAEIPLPVRKPKKP